MSEENQNQNQEELEVLSADEDVEFKAAEILPEPSIKTLASSAVALTPGSVVGAVLEKKRFSHVTAVLSNTGANPVTFTLEGSVDNVTWAPAVETTASIAAGAVGSLSTSKYFPYVRVRGVATTGASTATGKLVTIALMPGGSL